MNGHDHRKPRARTGVDRDPLMIEHACVAPSGDDDFLLHVAVQDLDHLHAFLTDRLSKRGEITGFRTSVIFQQVSNTAPARLD